MRLARQDSGLEGLVKHFGQSHPRQAVPDPEDTRRLINRVNYQGQEIKQQREELDPPNTTHVLGRSLRRHADPKGRQFYQRRKQFIFHGATKHIKKRHEHRSQIRANYRDVELSKILHTFQHIKRHLKPPHRKLALTNPPKLPLLLPKIHTNENALNLAPVLRRHRQLLTPPVINQQSHRAQKVGYVNHRYCMVEVQYGNQ